MVVSISQRDELDLGSFVTIDTILPVIAFSSESSIPLWLFVSRLMMYPRLQPVLSKYIVPAYAWHCLDQLDGCNLGSV